MNTYVNTYINSYIGNIYTIGGQAGQVLAALMEINAFKLFNDCVTALIMDRSNMTPVEFTYVNQ